MNIGILVYDISLTGGAEHVALNMAESLAYDYRVCLISVFSSRVLNLKNQPNYKSIVLTKKTKSITKNFFPLTNILKKKLIDEDIDILIAITAGVVTLANFASKSLKTQTIYAEHSNLENRTYGFKHIFRQFVGAHLSEYVVTLTERDRLNFIRLFKVRPSKVITIPNWVDKVTVTNKTYNCKSKLIMSVGRLERVKGYNYLLKVAKRVLAEHDDWQWHIYGEGSLRSLLQYEIEKEKLVNKLILMGNVQDILERYSRYSFLVMTSIYEGLPLSLIEAQSQGLPLISFDCPTGPSEIITDNVNGYLVKPFDTVEMENRVNELIVNEPKRIDFSKHADINIAKFSKNTVLQQWKALFNRLVV